MDRHYFNKIQVVQLVTLNDSGINGKSYVLVEYWSEDGEGLLGRKEYYPGSPEYDEYANQAILKSTY